MRYSTIIGLFSAIILVIACFLPWVFIETAGITVSGVSSEGTNFGKPGYFHFLFTVFFIAFTLIPRVWAKRLNLVVVSLNIAWAIRNYFIISLCRAGDCPEKKIGLFVIVIASILMLVSALFPDMRLKESKQ